MKKLALIFILLLLGSLLFAQSFMSAGFGWQFVNQMYSISGSDQALNFSSQGVNVSSFYGEKLGFLITANFLFLPLRVTLGGSPLALESYSNAMALELFLGPGYLLSISGRFKAVLAVVLHWAQISLISTSAPIFGTDYSLGAGISGSVYIYLLDGFFLYAVTNLAYDFLGLTFEPDINRKLWGGLSAGVSGGLGFTF